MRIGEKNKLKGTSAF